MQPRRQPSPAKKYHNCFWNSGPFPRRRPQDADRTRDLRWLGRRPGCFRGAWAGERPHDSEDRREIDLIVLPCLPAGRRWFMERTFLSGDRRNRAAAAKDAAQPTAPVGREEPGRLAALKRELPAASA